MNEAFNGVFVREDVSQPSPNPNNIFQGPKVEDVTITRQRIKKRLEELKVNKTPGPDGISALILKECSEVLCEPLSDIF